MNMTSLDALKIAVDLLNAQKARIEQLSESLSKSDVAQPAELDYSTAWDVIATVLERSKELPSAPEPVLQQYIDHLGVWREFDSDAHRRAVVAADDVEVRSLFTEGDLYQANEDGYAAGFAAGAVRTNQPAMKFVVKSYPESNGKRNWTAMIMRQDDAAFNGLVGTGGGIVLCKSEYWNRAAYAAERARYLFGQRDLEPNILDYGDDITTPDSWLGELPF